MRFKKYRKKDAIELIKSGKVHIMYNYHTKEPITLFECVFRPTFLKDKSLWVVKKENTKWGRKKWKFK
ncbi:hypothetical protein TwortDSMZ_149 [Staphylococcus phage Twort]|uniref:ORF186 n=2 Tax=Staphylococcus phage Twort (strain DSM 17442 / HER 48) TaxID=2908167 RepID=Q4Z996_BPTWO|nr:ORF186 [Staphylococcus phage Twort]AAX92453.1 ORF186 [Staphylococcus phage Twort]QIW89148.1 hypothetical protein TwortDSMZ_149 [Staphylococcus phage Twort]